ncbi:tail fiber assembly protein [Klebsiella pneumoniae]|nr:tail fiber assembly protein [Klebsiella pneumoniae]
MEQAKLNSSQIATEAGYVTVFNYDSATREYLSSAVEYLQTGVSIPANSCIDAPAKSKPGFAICRTADLTGWEYVVDHRGETVYSTETGGEIAITAPGDYPQCTTAQAPATKYDTWSGKEWVADPQKLQSYVGQQKSALKVAADAEIAWRQDAVDAGIATAEEADALAEWKKYRVLLMRVDTSKAPDILWPPQP